MSLPYQICFGASSHIHFKVLTPECISVGSLQHIIFDFIYRQLKE